jgi:hypothetical protein
LPTPFFVYTFNVELEIFHVKVTGERGPGKKQLKAVVTAILEDEGMVTYMGVLDDNMLMTVDALSQCTPAHLGDIGFSEVTANQLLTEMASYISDKALGVKMRVRVCVSVGMSV